MDSFAAQLESAIHGAVPRVELATARGPSGKTGRLWTEHFQEQVSVVVVAGEAMRGTAGIAGQMFGVWGSGA